MGLTDDRDISETVSETWSTDVLGSDFDPNMDEDRLQEIAGGLSFWSRICRHSLISRQMNGRTDPMRSLHILSEPVMNCLPQGLCLFMKLIQGNVITLWFWVK